jgi:hypothetical protein
MQHGPTPKIQKFILETMLRQSDLAHDRKPSGLKVAQNVRAADGVISHPADGDFKLIVAGMKARLSALSHVTSPPVCDPGSDAPLEPKPVHDVKDQIAGLKEKIFPTDVSGLAAADAKGLDTSSSVQTATTASSSARESPPGTSHSLNSENVVDDAPRDDLERSSIGDQATKAREQVEQ